MVGKTITIEITHNDDAMLAARVTTVWPATAEKPEERSAFVDSVAGPAARRPLKLWKRLEAKLRREFGK